jgi:hypothetical protein
VKSTIVVGGANKGVGKTALICGIIAAFPQINWSAIKITSDIHETLGAPSFQRLFAGRVGSHELPQLSPTYSSIWEETVAGQGTDTGRYLAAGATRAIFVTAAESDISIDEIQAAIGPDSGTASVIFESNRIIGVLKPDICVAVIGNAQSAVKASFQPFAQRADAFVSTGVESDRPSGGNPHAPIFHLDSLKRVSGEMLAWMQARLRLTQIS